MPQQQICRHSLAAELKSLGRGLTGQRKLPLQVDGALSAFTRLHRAFATLAWFRMMEYISTFFVQLWSQLHSVRCLSSRWAFFLWACSDLRTFGLKGWTQWRPLCFHSDLSFISFFFYCSSIRKWGRGGQKASVSSPSSGASPYHNMAVKKTKKKFRWQNKTSSHLGNGKLRTWREIQRKYGQLVSL